MASGTSTTFHLVKHKMSGGRCEPDLDQTLLQLIFEVQRFVRLLMPVRFWQFTSDLAPIRCEQILLAKKLFVLFPKRELRLHRLAHF